MDSPSPAFEVLVVGGGILVASAALTIRERRPKMRICFLETEDPAA
jgi:L-2-hydroxyglutarate oxidase LhgO